MSFAAGFQLGNRIVGEIEDSRRQKVLDERAAKEFARKEQEWSRADAERANIDRAISEYQDLASTGQAVAENTSGFSAPSARMLYSQGGQQAVDDAASYANAENARFGLPLANRTSLPATPDAAPAPTVKMRQATPLDRIKGLEGIALAKKDVSAMERLGGQRQVAEEDMFIADAMKSYKGTEDQIGGTASYINTNSKRVTMGSPGKNGFVPLSIVATDGRAEFLNLSKQDQAKLYAAGQLMERNPTRALEIMSSVNKELASAIAQENGLVDKLATNTNDVAYKGGKLDIDRQQAASADEYRRSSIELSQQRAAMGRMGSAKYFEGDDGKVYASIPTMGKNGLTFQTVEVNPQGVGLRLPNARSGQPTKPVKVPEAGEKFMVDGALKVTDGQGGYIDPKGVLPDMRGAALKKAGIPDEMVGQLPWNADGTKVLFGDMAYDVRDPKDMRALREDYKRLAGNTIALEEANRQDSHLTNNPRRGFGPDITMRPPSGMPSIYADPAAWEAYRNQRGR